MLAGEGRSRRGARRPEGGEAEERTAGPRRVGGGGDPRRGGGGAALAGDGEAAGARAGDGVGRRRRARWREDGGRPGPAGQAWAALAGGAGAAAGQVAAPDSTGGGGGENCPGARWKRARVSSACVFGGDAYL